MDSRLKPIALAHGRADTRRGGRYRVHFTTVTNCQKQLKRACDELGLRTVIPFDLRLGSGTVIDAEALLPQLGHPNGYMVSTTAATHSVTFDQMPPPVEE